MGSAPSELSMVRVTSARPNGARPDVPAKMTSSILPPRSAFAPCSPSTQAIAATTLLLPDPFGPTTAVMPGSKRNVVVDAKDLKPRSVKDLRCTYLPGTHRTDGATRRGTNRPTPRRCRRDELIARTELTRATPRTEGDRGRSHRRWSHRRWANRRGAN